MMMLLLILFAIHQCSAQVPDECKDKQISNVTIDEGAIEKAVKHISQLQAMHNHRLQDRHLKTFHIFMEPISRFYSLGNTLYALSNEPSQDAYMAFGICAFYGGYLLQLDDHSEFGEAKNNLASLADIKCVWLGMMDRQLTDNWIFPLTQMPAFKSFSANQTEVKMCAKMDRTYKFEMRKASCETLCHFVCEIPDGA